MQVACVCAVITHLGRRALPQIVEDVGQDHLSPLANKGMRGRPAESHQLSRSGRGGAGQ